MQLNVEPHASMVCRASFDMCCERWRQPLHSTDLRREEDMKCKQQQPLAQFHAAWQA